MDGEPKYGRVQELHTPNEAHQEYSSLWDDDITKRDSVDLKNNTSGAQLHTWKQSVQRHVLLWLQAIPPFWQHTAWPMIKKTRVKKEQIFALIILWICAIIPFIVLGCVTGRRSFFDGVFDEKTLPCGDGGGISNRAVNNTVGGIEGLFVLDATYGSFPFSTVKIIDVTWDVMVGRGAQMLAWWISYKVFSGAILRVIERHPTSYRAFFEICLHGPSFPALWVMLKDLTRTKSKRTWSLYFYIVWSILYIITLPIMLSAMTGYTSNSVAWVDVDDSTEIMPASMFNNSYVLSGVDNHTFSPPKCLSYDEPGKFMAFNYSMRDECDCRLPNGTITTEREWSMDREPILSNSSHWQSSRNYTWFRNECDYKYPGQKGTFTLRKYRPTNNADSSVRSCNGSMIEIDGTGYNGLTLNYTSGFCSENRAYYQSSVKARCLPDTQNVSYRWGFSTMLSGVFVIVNFVWALTMYVVWQDAQFHSNLVRNGYVMTPLRAAFTLATVARNTIGCGNVDLIRADAKELDDKLFGNSSKKIRQRGAEVDYSLFEDSGKQGWEMMSDTESGLRQRSNGVTTSEG